MSRPPAGFAAELAAARAEQGLTLAQVAERAGVTEATVSHWETGRAVPYGDSLTAWAAALGYQIGLYMPLDADYAQPLTPGLEYLFQELIGALAGLFEDDEELQEAAA